MHTFKVSNLGTFLSRLPISTPYGDIIFEGESWAVEFLRQQFSHQKKKWKLRAWSEDRNSHDHAWFSSVIWSYPALAPSNENWNLKTITSKYIILPNCFAIHFWLGFHQKDFTDLDTPIILRDLKKVDCSQCSKSSFFVQKRQKVTF